MLFASTTSRRTLLGGGAALCAALTLEAASQKHDWRALAEDVRSEMRWAWWNYREHA